MDSFAAQYSGWGPTSWITQSKFGLLGLSQIGVQSKFSTYFNHRFNSSFQPSKGATQRPTTWTAGWDTGGHMRRWITLSIILIPGSFGTLLASMRMSWYVATCMQFSRLILYSSHSHTTSPTPTSTSYSCPTSSINSSKVSSRITLLLGSAITFIMSTARAVLSR